MALADTVSKVSVNVARRKAEAEAAAVAAQLKYNLDVERRSLFFTNTLNPTIDAINALDGISLYDFPNNGFPLVTDRFYRVCFSEQKYETTAVVGFTSNPMEPARLTMTYSYVPEYTKVANQFARPVDLGSTGEDIMNLLDAAIQECGPE